MRNQAHISEGSVLSEVFYVVFIDLLQAAACDSEICPDVYFGGKINDKDIEKHIFFCKYEVFCFFVSKYSFVSGLGLSIDAGVQQMPKKRRNCLYSVVVSLWID